MSNRKREAASSADINVAAEQSLLGCVLRRDQVFFEVHNDVEAADFADPRHRTIWKTVEKIAGRAQGRFDAATVADFLQGSDESVPRDYLDALADAVADPSAVQEYVRTVVDLSRQRAMVKAMQDGIARLRMRAPDEPLNEVVDEINGAVLDAGRADSSTQKTLAEYADQSYRRMEAVFYGQTKTVNLSWGLSAIDGACGPGIPGHFHVIGGRPEMGKTALANGIALAFGRQAPGAIIELEMRGEALADRSLAHLTGVPAWKITRNEALGNDYFLKYGDAISELHRLPIWVEARPGLTTKQIAAKCIGMRRRHGCRWFIFDHIQIVASAMRRPDPSETIDEFCRTMAALGKEIDAVMVALSQVNSKNRDRDNDRPQPRDLMYYNSIEPHADVIMFPYRPEVALRERRPPEPIKDDKKGEAIYFDWEERLKMAKDKAEIICGKNRHGPSGEFRPCLWDGPLMKFKPIDVARAASDEQSYLEM